MGSRRNEEASVGQISRRRALAVLGGASLAAGVGLPGVAWAQADGWGKLKGQTVFVRWPDKHHFEIAKSLLPAFTSATGIKVELSQAPQADLRSELSGQLAKPIGDIDVVAYDPLWKMDFARRNFLVELLPMFKNADLAMPGYDADDLIQPFLEGIGFSGGRRGYLGGPGAKLYGIPFGVECSVLAYRGDILRKHSLAVPKTYDELLKAARLIKDKEPGMGGLGVRTREGRDATDGWLMHLTPNGGEVLDETYQPQVAKPAALEATRIYKELVDTGPDGGDNFDGAQVITSFLEGGSALYLDSVSIFAPAADPERSKVIEHIGYAPHPVGTRASGALRGWGLAIAQNSPRKEAAFVFLQWITAKAQDARIAASGGFPSRLSSLAHPDVKKRYPVAVYRQCIEIANPNWRPLILEWEEISENILGVYLARVATGKMTIEAAMRQASDAIGRVCERAGYYRQP
jgi:multiple sugar transport system substrate-binding protein